VEEHQTDDERRIENTMPAIAPARGAFNRPSRIAGLSVAWSFSFLVGLGNKRDGKPLARIKFID